MESGRPPTVGRPEPALSEHRRIVMSRKNLTLIVLLAAVLSPTAGLAQGEEEKTPLPYVYGIYYECDVARQELADEIMELVFKPEFDAAVDSGAVISWGWMAHHTGGKWRRLMYHSAPSLGTLLDALGSVNDSIDEKYPEMGHAFAEICGTHDDYIWQGITGSRGGNIGIERGTAGFSVYMKCDMSREARADELFKEAFAPIFDRHVAEGNLKSWGWMEHVVGGVWRRILTMTAADNSSLLDARTAIIQEMYEGNEEAGTEFDSICGSHQDYIWDILFEKP